VNPTGQPHSTPANPYAPAPAPAAPPANPYAQPPAPPAANPYTPPSAAPPYSQPPAANPYAAPAAPPTVPLPQPPAPVRPLPPAEPPRAPIITPSATAAPPGGRLQDQEVERYYPNNMGRFVFIALEELLGRNGLNAVLNLAGLSRFINNYPPNNMEKRFSFAHYAAVNKAIEDFYGARGSKGLLLRVGKVSLTHALGMYTAFAGIGNLSMRLMPQSMKVKITLTVIAQTFRTISDQVSRVLEEPEAYIFENETCSMCWRRTSSQPCCHIATGVLIAALHWATGKNYKVTEVQCMAMGAPTCRFVIDKQPIE
jgi:predicted hydrocarbon binding protein